AQSPSTLSSRISAEPSMRKPFMLCDVAAKASLPNGSRPGTMKSTSSDIRLSTVAVSPARLAFIQVSTMSRMARSSGAMAAPSAFPCIDVFDRDMVPIFSNRAVAAVRHDDRSCHISRQIGRKEDGWAGNVFRLAGAAERRVVEKDFHQVRVVGAHLCV